MALTIQRDVNAEVLQHRREAVRMTCVHGLVLLEVLALQITLLFQLLQHSSFL